MIRCIPVVFAVLFGVILPSINGLSCYSCSHTAEEILAQVPDGIVDISCRDALTTATAYDNNTACVVAGILSASKSILQMIRMSAADNGSIPNFPSVNDGCRQGDNNGEIVYGILCACYTDNCNTFVINNCTCETPATSTTSTTSTTTTASTTTIASTASAASTTTTASTASILTASTASTTSKTPTASTTTLAKNAALPLEIERILPAVLAIIATAAARLF